MWSTAYFSNNLFRVSSYWTRGSFFIRCGLWFVFYTRNVLIRSEPMFAFYYVDPLLMRYVFLVIYFVFIVYLFLFSYDQLWMSIITTGTHPSIVLIQLIGLVCRLLFFFLTSFFLSSFSSFSLVFRKQFFFDHQLFSLREWNFLKYYKTIGIFFVFCRSYRWEDRFLHAMKIFSTRFWLNRWIFCFSFFLRKYSRTASR